MHMQKKSLPYRLCVGIMLLNRDNLVFVGQRINGDQNAWQMPQGGINEKENPKSAALRELEEETSIKDVEIITKTNQWLSYDLPAHLLGKVWEGRYRGQKQLWFMMKFLGHDKDINIQTRHPEFQEWRWEAMDSLPALIVPFKKLVYEEVVEKFLPFIPKGR